MNDLCAEEWIFLAHSNWTPSLHWTCLLSSLALKSLKFGPLARKYQKEKGRIKKYPWNRIIQSSNIKSGMWGSDLKGKVFFVVWGGDIVRVHVRCLTGRHQSEKVTIATHKPGLYTPNLHTRAPSINLGGTYLSSGQGEVCCIIPPVWVWLGWGMKHSLGRWLAFCFSTSAEFRSPTLYSLQGEIKNGGPRSFL